MDSVISADGRLSVSNNQQQQVIELQPLKEIEKDLSNSNRLSASHHSLASSHSVKQGHTPRQSPERRKKLLEPASEVSQSKDSGSFATVVMSTSVGSASPLEHKRTTSLNANPVLTRNAASSELLDVRPNMALLRKSSAPALAVSEVTGQSSLVVLASQSLLSSLCLWKLHLLYF